MIDYTFEKADNISSAMKNLYEIVTILRDPEDGCPWDKEQTAKDIVRDLQGEIYEYIDALSEGDNEHIKEELGDVFMSLFLLVAIHNEADNFNLTDCLNETCEKYIRRHPHVFKGEKLENSNDVKTQWEYIKKNVEGRNTEEGFFGKEIKNIPELERCYRISKKAAGVGFEWDNIGEVAEKVREEINEVENADKNTIESELGDVLFAAVNLCRFSHVKPQDALQHANVKFINRFEYINDYLKKNNLRFSDLSKNQLNELWNQSKKVFPV